MSCGSSFFDGGGSAFAFCVMPIVIPKTTRKFDMSIVEDGFKQVCSCNGAPRGDSWRRGVFLLSCLSTREGVVDVYKSMATKTIRREKSRNKKFGIYGAKQKVFQICKNGSIDARHPPKARLYNARMEEKQRQRQECSGMQ